MLRCKRQHQDTIILMIVEPREEKIASITVWVYGTDVVSNIASVDLHHTTFGTPSPFLSEVHQF